MKVELLHFPGCPHVDAARTQLRRAFERLGKPAAWVEVDVSAPPVPSHARGYGSPSILVDGRDVLGEGPANGSSCRLYVGTDLAGAPPLERILSALAPAADG